MSNNGIAKFLTSAKTVISIMVILVALVVWFVVLKEDVATNTKQLESVLPKVQDNRENILIIQSDIKHTKATVDMIWEKVK